MKARRRQRFLRRLVLGLAFAAFAAPVAQAESWYLGKGVLKDVGQAQTSSYLDEGLKDAGPSALLNQRQVEQVAGYGRGVQQSAGAIPYLSHGVVSTPGTISIDRKADLVRPSDLPTSFVGDDGGLSWGDAGIGAGTMLALLAIVAAGAGVARSRRRPQAA